MTAVRHDRLACAAPGQLVESVAMDTWPSLEAVAFEDLYVREYPGLLAVATALSGDRDQGEDFVQDTMVRAFVHWPRVSRLDRPGGWCHRVLTNICRSWWRRRRTERRYLAAQRGTTVIDAGPGPEAVAFWAAVRTLPTRPRHVVVLHFAADRTMAEVAAILDLPEGTVRSDIARARVAIMRHMGLEP